MRKASLFVLFLTVFIDLIGFGMVIPFLSFYAREYGATGLEVGAVVGVYSIMQFFFAPIWGRLSDRIGRRPVILISLTASAAGYLMFGFAHGLPLLFVSRLVAGAGGANIGTAQAYIADVTTPENRAKGMGIIGAAFGEALTSVYGYSGDLSRYDFSGRTDPQITAMVLGDAGFTQEQIDAQLPEMWRHYLAGLERNAAKGTVRALPGIRDAVERLSVDSRVTLALLTGNIEKGARLKLGGAGLNAFFPFGAFGSDSPRREELPPFAVARAAERTSLQFSPRDVVIIGDSIYDVRCGLPHGATTIAVASGRTTAATLLAENPDHFFASAEDAGFLDAVLGN